jgi:hypothetical protein
MNIDEIKTKTAQTGCPYFLARYNAISHEAWGLL